MITAKEAREKTNKNLKEKEEEELVYIESLISTAINSAEREICIYRLLLKNNSKYLKSLGYKVKKINYIFGDVYRTIISW